MNALIQAFTQGLMPHLMIVPILLPLLTACLLLLLGDRRYRRKAALSTLAALTNLVVAWLLLRWVRHGGSPGAYGVYLP